ncbi:MAG: DUF3592 domain-containing protein [Rubrivivax sp.]|nr:DUF3592 domain-containing protein [Pyrinomonadaceae bacterium]
MFKLFGWFFLLCGLFAVSASLYLAYSAVHFSKVAESTTGTVTDLVMTGQRSPPTYAPVVRFQTKTGEVKEFRGSYSSSPPPHQIGDTVTVWYAPQDSDHAVVYYSIWSLWFFPLVSLLIAPIFVVMGLVFIRMAKKF